MKTRNQITLLKSFYLILIVSITIYGTKDFIEGWNSVSEEEQHETSLHKSEVYLLKKNQNNIQWINKKNNDTLDLKNVSILADIHLLNKNGDNSHLSLLTFLFEMSILLPVSLVIYFFATLYNFIDSISKERIFELENYRRLKLMSYSMIALPFLFYLYDYSKYYSTKITLSSTPYEVVNNTDFDFMMLFFGITLLTISFVFKKGIDLKKEQDLTI